MDRATGGEKDPREAGFAVRASDVHASEQFAKTVQSRQRRAKARSSAWLGVLGFQKSIILRPVGRGRLRRLWSALESSRMLPYSLIGVLDPSAVQGDSALQDVARCYLPLT